MAKKKKEEPKPVVSTEASFETKVRMKVLGRQLAEASVAGEKSMAKIKGLPEYAQRTYLETIAKSIGFNWEGMLDETRSVMSDAEAKQFSAEPIGFGRHLNTPNAEVPEDYLDWLADRCTKFLQWYRWFVDRKTR